MLNKAHVIDLKKDNKKFVGCSMQRETCQQENKKQTEKKEQKTEDSEKLFLKALANRFWLTSKPSTVQTFIVQQSC